MQARRAGALHLSGQADSCGHFEGERSLQVILPLSLVEASGELLCCSQEIFVWCSIPEGSMLAHYPLSIEITMDFDCRSDDRSLHELEREDASTCILAGVAAAVAAGRITADAMMHSSAFEFQVVAVCQFGNLGCWRVEAREKRIRNRGEDQKGESREFQPLGVPSPGCHTEQ